MNQYSWASAQFSVDLEVKVDLFPFLSHIVSSRFRIDKLRSSSNFRVSVIVIMSLSLITNQLWNLFHESLNLKLLTLDFTLINLRDAYPFQNGWIFGKVPKGGGGHFQSKNLYCKIWTFKQGFFSMKVIQKGLLGYVFTLLPCWTFVLHASHGK